MCVCVCDCHVRFGGPEIMTRGSQQMGPFVTKYLPQIRWVFFSFLWRNEKKIFTSISFSN